MSKYRDEVLFVRTTKVLKRKVVAVASALETDASQFCRDVINEKIDALALSNPKVAQALEESTEKAVA